MSVLVTLRNLGELIQISLPPRQLTALATVSAYFRNVQRQVANGISTSADLSEYELNSYLFLLDIVNLPQLPTPTANMSISDFNKFMLYVGVSDPFEQDFTTDAETLTNADLDPIDRELRAEELRLRLTLYSEEDVDHRAGDSRYFFETVCQRLVYPLLINPGEVPLSHVPTPEQDNHFWGLFGADLICERDHRNWNGQEIPNFPAVPGYHLCHKHLHDTSKLTNPAYEIQTQDTYPRIGRQMSITSASRRYQRVGSLLSLVSFGIFDGFDFTDLFIAGGSIFTLLTGYHGSRGDKAKDIVNDIDVFIITKDQERADQAVMRLLTRVYNTESQDMSVRSLILQTENSITIQGDGMKIQIILRLYNSVAQVLAGFDLDSASIGFDGHQLYCMPRFVRMLQAGANLVDFERQSRSYAFRLMKYLRRGVGLLLPGYSEERVMATYPLLLKPGGMAKVLRTYRNFLIRGRGEDKVDLRRQGVDDTDEVLVEENDYDITYPNRLDVESVNDSVLKRALDHYRKINGWEREGYNQVEENPLAYLAEHDMLHVPYLLVDNIDELFTGIHSDDSLAPKLMYDLPVGVRYRIRNPGTQLTNSFYPTNDEWFRDLYVMETDQMRYKEEVEREVVEEEKNEGLD